MGVPKFFRYISERYPCLSEFVKEYQIPEFDNLYLDMNGIIHMCSHPDDGDPHFRITEEKIFADIFHYIEVLFRMIRPQKLFFMAIDGVAPRAKMNQQRGRRFRSAKDAEKLEKKAVEKGEVLPPGERFDSNCITPGTVFMAKLHEQLKYFVVNKITTDKLWSNCKVVLSGHETPGEGEHKIMDYIRYLKAQPGYDPNTRHCLYGLDADLIMLGLCTHEPHFSLLREEVLFGKKSQKRRSAPEQISFYLLHLSLMREYLELEFQALKTSLKFDFNIENIIDDWVLMSFLVGNDFIPHLPHFHIANGALPILYNAYINVLPSLGGYINEGGHLHLDRFEKFMDALCSIDMDNFSEQYADLKYFEAKTGRRPNEKQRTSYKPKKLEEWKPEEDLIIFETLEPEKPMNADLVALIKATEDMFLEPSEENLDILAGLEDEKEEDEVGHVDIDSCSEAGEDDREDLLNAEFKQHKKDYYMNKLDYAQVTPEVMRDQAECYVRAIQWNLNYYYNGVCSWGWFYPHHYAPFISDIKGFQDIDFEFELGHPFRPYEQLLAVLPAASKSLLPECYHHLMTEESSVIKDYYPVDFNTDLNGKRQDWEAVVLIPFIDEKVLLEAMGPCNLLLTQDEVKRNTHGPMMAYKHTDVDMGDYEAPEYFPLIKHHHVDVTPVSIEEIRVPKEKLIKGAYPGVVLDVYYPGFPTMKHLNYSARLEKAKVKVFDQPSRGENMVINIQLPQKEGVIEVLAKQLLGKSVFVGWPHLVEAMVVALSTKNFRYLKTSTEGEYNVEENHGNVAQHWEVERNGIIEYYRERLGIDVGGVKILVHVTVMTGRKYIFTPQGRINLEKQWAEVTSVYPLQTIVKDIAVYNKQYSSYKDVQDVFTLGSQCFMMGQPHYGCLGTVMDSKETLLKGRVKLNVKIPDEPDFESAIKLEKNIKVNYMNLHAAAARLGISNHLFSRVTGTLLIILGCRRDGSLQDDQSKINVGLNLKYNKKNEEIPGYTRKDRIWLYSQKVIDLVQQYMALYPHLFEYLHTNAENDIFYEYELFPQDNGSGLTVKEIADWLKKQPHNSVERKSCGSTVLEGDVVKEIEDIIDNYITAKKSKTVVMQVKPHLLYKPDIQMGNIAPDPLAMYKLYDRVINIRECYTVPLGYAGTIIAVHKSSSGKPEDTVYDVVFDKPFAGGMSLNCSPNRGYRMSKFSLINKSFGQRAFEQKTGKPGQLLQQLQQPNKPQTIQQACQQQNYTNFNMYQPQNSAFASWNNPAPSPNQQRSGSANAQFAYQNFSFPPPNKQHNLPPPVANEKYFTSPAADQKAMDTKAQNFFMPYFAHPEQKPTGRKQRTKKNDFVPPFSEQPRQELKVDTDLLKKILKIEDEPVKKDAKQSQELKNGDDGIKLSVQDIFAHASAQIQPVDNSKSVQHLPTLPPLPPLPVLPPLPLPTLPPMLPLQATNNCSLQLLSYYQMQGLGCPHYRYFDTPDGKLCQAQLTMPFSKESIFGQPAANKEQACENVAKIVLQKLLAAAPANPVPPPGPNLPVQFPFPPKQWCEPENRKPGRQSSPQNNATIQNKKNDEKQGINPKPADAPVPFVPLQAVRQRANKTSSTNESSPLSEKKIENHKNTSTEIKADLLPVKSEAGCTEAEGTKLAKPRRKRKMRIAANFSGAPNKS